MKGDKEMRRDIHNFIDKFSKEIIDENAVVFAGAGFSQSVGFVNWGDLLRPLAEEIGMDVEQENDLVSLAQYYCNVKRNRTEINQRIVEEFERNVKISLNHQILASLPIKTYWTTNYDELIEEALKQAGKVVDTKSEISHLSYTVPKRDAVVYKMHGDKKNPSKAVILKEDYEVYHKTKEPFITALSGDLVSKTFLFIGFSFTDPNLDYILSRMRINYGENQRTHYAFIKNVGLEDIKNKGKSESDIQAELDYAKRKQDLFIEDLKRYNIQALRLDSYAEITEILKLIKNKVIQKNVFISGSANNFSPWTNEKAEEFVSKLSKALIKRNYNIVSGFGLGVGSLVISGSLEEIYMNQKTMNNNQLILRPFPQPTSSGQDYKHLWRQYREDMISTAGISIFIFGNKKVVSEQGEMIVNADGVYAEFEISTNNNNIIIPVGATGSMAKIIWNQVEHKFEEFYPKSSEELRTLFNELDNDTLSSEQLVEVIIKFINEVDRCTRI